MRLVFVLGRAKRFEETYIMALFVLGRANAICFGEGETVDIDTPIC